MRRLAVLYVLLSACAFAQTMDGLTTSASKTITLWPDNAVFVVDVTSAAGTTVDQAVAWLSGTGITATNLVGAGSTQDYLSSLTPVMRMQHEFQMTVPYPKISDMTEKLRTATRSVTAAGGNLAYGLTLTASDDALQLARQRVLPDLITEVKRRADTLAQASGLMVGTIQAISDNSYVSGVISASRIYGSSTTSAGLQATFSVSAKFSVLR